MTAMRCRRNDATLATIAALSLLCGLAAYWVGRPAGSVYALARLPAFPSVGDCGSCRVLANYLPDFVHPYAFILLTVAGVAWSGRRSTGMICIGWAAVDILFEVGQHPGISASVAAAIPRWFDRVPVLDSARGFFVAGRFDWRDVLAIALGSTLAWVTVAVARGEAFGRNELHPERRSVASGASSPSCRTTVLPIIPFAQRRLRRTWRFWEIRDIRQAVEILILRPDHTADTHRRGVDDTIGQR